MATGITLYGDLEESGRVDVSKTQKAGCTSHPYSLRSRKEAPECILSSLKTCLFAYAMGTFYEHMTLRFTTELNTKILLVLYSHAMNMVKIPPLW